MHPRNLMCSQHTSGQLDDGHLPTLAVTQLPSAENIVVCNALSCYCMLRHTLAAEYAVLLLAVLMRASTALKSACSVVSP